jgi:hypothetical protein
MIVVVRVFIDADTKQIRASIEDRGCAPYTGIHVREATMWEADKYNPPILAGVINEINWPKEDLK